MYVLLLALYGCLCLVCGLLIFILLRVMCFGLSEQAAGEAVPDVKNMEEDMEEENEEKELL